MKKHNIIIAISLMILAFFLFASCTNKDNNQTTKEETGFTLVINGTRYTKTSEEANISISYGDSWKSKITVEVSYSDGTYETISTGYTIGSNLSDVLEVGSYQTTVDYKNYGSIGLTINVEPKEITKPNTNNKKLNYTGEEVVFVPSGFDDNTMNIVNNVQTDQGTYIATISLKDKTNYIWSDKTTDDISINWSIEEGVLSYQITLIDDTTIQIVHYEDEKEYVATFVYTIGTRYVLDQETGALEFIFSDITTEEITFAFSGEYFGSIKFNINEEDDATLELNGFSITSELDCPIHIETAGNFDISAKKNTENFVYDNRAEVEDLKAAIYATCDLKLKGTGSLTVTSKNNNGIHTKDDLKIQKLTLVVNSVDNALKGNDGVTISSGNLTLIARKGDGIKTSNSSLSSKGKQKGTVTIEDGTIDIYAACDGIDAAYDIVINGGTINIYTDKYSEYSEEVTVVKEDTYYIKASTNSYKYSVYYYNDATSEDGIWINAENTYETVTNFNRSYYYYKFEKLTDYKYIKVYVYSSTQSQGQSISYTRVSSQMTINTNYDTIEFGSSNRPGSSSNSFNWTNYSTTTGPVGPGGMDEGNKDKGDYSTKGLKADNEINITAGNINIKSYDDAIHTNNDVTLESGVTSTGNINISGGTLTLYSNDDAIHADGCLTIDNGTITVLNSYEGLEGTKVVINGGDISIISSDDGINGTGTSGTSITIAGGTVYVYAGGDGVDSNSQDSYGGILFSGGYSVIISYGRSDSSIDTERGYKYTGGYVVGIGLSGGMSRESTMEQNFNSIGESKTISIQKDNYLVVSGIVTVKLPQTMNSLVVVLGSTSASITTTASSDLTFNSNGVCWLK